MKVSEISLLINAEYLSKVNYEIIGISDYKSPLPQSIILILNEKYFEYIENSLPDDCIILTDLKFKNLSNKFNLLISNNPKLAFSKISKIFKRYSSLFKYDENFHLKKNSFFGRNISIGKNCLFGNNVCLEDGVIIGDNSIISHNVTICENVIIGNNNIIDVGTIIGSEGFGNVLDDDLTWSHIYHHGSVVIGNNVQIGANCTIDRGTIQNTVIEDGVIIDNMVHIAHNVKIGSDTAIAAKVGIAGSCIIGKRNMLGGMVGIVDHINTSDDVIISATSTVSKNIKEPGTYTAIMPISKHVTWKRIAMWITKLDKIAKFLNINKI